MKEELIKKLKAEMEKFKEKIRESGVDLSWSIQNACLPSISKYPTFVPLQVTPEDDKFVTVAA